MTTHYFSLRGRAYTHNCDQRTHTLSNTVVLPTSDIWGHCALLWCAASSFPSSVLQQQRCPWCCSYYFFPAAGPPLVGSVSPRKVIIFSALHLAGFTVFARATVRHYLTFLPTPPVRDFSVNFHHYFTAIRAGAFAFIFSLLPLTFPTKSKNDRTNEREKESRHY